MDLNQAFKTTSTILFQQDIGELQEFECYLQEMIDPVSVRKSALSGKEVFVSRKDYGRNAKFVSNDEKEQIRMKPASMNEIKDIDGLFQAVSENAYYAGNKNIGKTLEIEQSDGCNDSINIKKSYRVIKSEDVFSSSYIRESKQMFGCSWSGESFFCMRSHGLYQTSRLFESHLVVSSRDIYFSYNCRNCHETIFAFNQTAKSHVVGNRELEKTKYLEIKKRIIAEAAEILKKKKKLPSLFELMEGSK